MKKIITLFMACCLFMNLSYPIYAEQHTITILDATIDQDGYFKIQDGSIVDAQESDYQIKVEYAQEAINITLNNVDIDGNIEFDYDYNDNGLVRLYYEGDCSVGLISAIYELEVSGNGKLSVEGMFGKGTNHDTIIFLEGSNVDADYISNGASGGTDGDIIVHGVLRCGGTFNGTLYVGSTGQLYLEGRSTLNGKSEAGKEFLDAFVVEKGGYVEVDSQEGSIELFTSHIDNFDHEALGKENVFVLPNNYLPKDVELYKGYVNETIFVTFMYSDDVASGNTLSVDDAANQFVLAQRYEVKTQNCTADKQIALPNEIVTLQAEQPKENERFVGYTSNVEGLTINEDGTFVMPYSDVEICANYEERKIESLTLNKDEITFKDLNSEETLVATYIPEDETNINLVWTSSDESVATVDQNGKVTPLKDGETIITVTDTVSQLSDSCKVLVAVEYTITTIDCSADYEKATAQTVVTLTPTEKDGYRFIGYRSNVEGLVFENNAFTMPNENVTIYAEYELITMESLDIEEESILLEHEGETKQLTVIVKPDDIIDYTIIFESSDESVATVDDNGVVTAIGEGTCMIIVKNEDGTLEDSCVVEVDFEDESKEDTPQTPQETNDEDESKEDTNDKTYEDNQEDYQSPQTSDSSQFTTYLLMLLMSGFTLSWILKKRYSLTNKN